jgi:hypothetical protein
MLRRTAYGSWNPLLLLFCAGCAVATVECIVPSDMERYWLVTAGNWTLAHARILETLQGSWYPNRPWVNQEWLVGVATAWTRAHGAYALMELLFAAAMIFGVAFVAYECIRTRTHPLIACAQLIVTTMGAADFAQDRAQTLVWALLPALILVWRSRPWLAVPLLAIWANLHGSFPIALLWMLLHLDRRRVAPFIVAAIATFANPLGWHLWVFTVELARNARLATYVTEWTPALSSYAGIMTALLSLAPLWVRLPAGIRLRRPVRYGDILFLAAVTAGTILAIRYSMLLFLTTATTLGDSFRTIAKPMPFATRAATVVFTVLLLVLSAKFFFGSRFYADPYFGNVERGVNFADCAPLVAGKRVFTDALEIGSLVELAGGTANVDGRIDAFPRQMIHDSSFVLNHPKEASSIVDRSGAQALAIKGKFRPSLRNWHFERECMRVRVYDSGGTFSPSRKISS